MSRAAWRLAVIVGLCVALHAARPSGQSPAPSPSASAPQTPVFRAGVRLVEIDVFVTDRRGNVVHDLTAEDFEIVEDGAPQEIRTFSFVDLPLPSTEQPKRSGDVELDVTTNRQPPGRMYVLLLDAPSTAGTGNQARSGPAYEYFVQRFARQFVEGFVGPGDQVAVVHAQGTYEDAQGFTSDKRLLIRSVERFGRGLVAQDDLIGPEMVRRHLATLRAIEDLSARLGAISGRSKAILWVGGQMAFAPQDAVCPTPDPRQMCAVSAAAASLHVAYREAIAAAVRNNVTVHAVDPSGLNPEATGGGDMARRAALRGMAEDTGGVAIVNTNNFAGGFRTIVREHSSYYVLGYTPAVDYDDGKFHPVDVRVKRPGVRVRSRRGYLAPAPEPSRGDPPSLTAAARNALKMPVPVAGLGLDVSVAPFRATQGSGSRILLGGHVTGPLETADARIVLSYRVFKTDGKQQTSRFLEFRLRVGPERRDAVASAGVSFAERLTLPPGRYEIRVAADQPEGGVGSVVTHVVVPDFNGSLAMSGVALGYAGAGPRGLTLQTDAEIERLLGAAPTAVRAFVPGDQVRAFVEVYSKDKRITSDRLRLAATLEDDRGTVVQRLAPMLVDTLAGPSVDGRWGVLVPVEIDGVTPGSFMLCIEASAERADPVRKRIAVQVTAPRS